MGSFPHLANGYLYVIRYGGALLSEPRQPREGTGGAGFGNIQISNSLISLTIPLGIKLNAYSITVQFNIFFRVRFNAFNIFKSIFSSGFG